MKALTKLTAALLVFCLSACGSGTSSSSSDNQTASETAVSEPAETKSEKKSSKDKGTSFLEDQVLFDQEGLKITASYAEKMNEPGILIRFENGTGKNLSAWKRLISVNNYVTMGIESIDIPASGNDSEIFFTSWYIPAGLAAYDMKIENAEQFSISFRIFDKDAGNGTVFLDTPDLEVALNPLNPTGLIKYDEGLELYNEDGVRIVGRYMEKEKGSRVICFVENNSGQQRHVLADSLTVNGNETDKEDEETIPDGKMALLSLGIFQEDLDEYKIESIEDVKVALTISDENEEPIMETDLYSIPIE